MYRATPLLALLLLIPALDGRAQEAPNGPAHLYEAYYKVGYGDLAEWNRQYFEYGG